MATKTTVARKTTNNCSEKNNKQQHQTKTINSALEVKIYIEMERSFEITSGGGVREEFKWWRCQRGVQVVEVSVRSSSGGGVRSSSGGGVREEFKWWRYQ